ncbi:hypothetical protein M5689_011129 [Euphorbia peplus]|nr:hypothetical protein M5689_011129 [Euphorbia peplus]
MEGAVPTMIAKKLRKMLRIALFTVQKGVFNSKKRGKVVGKALNELMLEHQSSFSCQSHDAHMSFVSPISCRPSDVDLAFVSPREYEFSCTSSPIRSRKTHYQRKRRHERYYHAPPYVWAKSSGMSPLVRMRESEFLVDMEAEKFIQSFYTQLRLQKWMSANDSGSYY